MLHQPLAIDYIQIVYLNYYKRIWKQTKNKDIQNAPY